ncbi:hypothetical protein AAE478_006879 [Parahypoxylon ruwenzoriense]
MEGTHDSLCDELSDAICLLSLITSRPPTIGPIATSQAFHSHTDDPGNDHSDSPEDDFVDVEDLEVVGKDDDYGRYLRGLRDKLLDRLAEVLARYKSSPRAKNHVKDAQHVSSTMMIINEGKKSVKIICSKNEGLDGEDDVFLRKWTEYMVSISRSRASKTGSNDIEDTKAKLFELVLRHQKSRITYYTGILKKLFETHRQLVKESVNDRYHQFQRSIERQVWARSRIWTDYQGFEYEIPVRSDLPNTVTEGTHSGMQDDAEVILDIVYQLRSLDPCTAEGMPLLKQLMETTLQLWKFSRSRSAVKFRLDQIFGQNKSLKKQATTALLFLCRIYYCVQIFVEAAEKLDEFQSIECIMVPCYQSSTNNRPNKKTTPLEIAKSMGIQVANTRWVNYLRGETGQFRKLRSDKRGVHAEIQVLLCFDTISKANGYEGTVHDYIGCSRRCCLLCHCFIRIRGGFRVRGTHETIMHRWDLPRQGTEILSTISQSTVASLIDHLKSCLRAIFAQSFPTGHRQSLAQSSYALSTVHDLQDKDLVNMKGSSRDMQKLMMMPMVGDSISVTKYYNLPGRAFVIDPEGLKKGKEMSVGDAELYHTDYLRSKFGLEKLDEMPLVFIPKAKVCRHCGGPSLYRCSQCRMRYCSQSCQARDWGKHSFVCSVKGRPNDIDRLRILVKRRFTDENEASKIIEDIFADDEICQTFGFNQCLGYDEISILLCIYRIMTAAFKNKFLQHQVDNENLGLLMEQFAESQLAEGSSITKKCSCFLQFLRIRRNQHRSFDIPSYGSPVYWDAALVALAETFVSFGSPDGSIPSDEDKSVAVFYSILLRPFNNIPSVYTGDWISFGFCYCKNLEQAKRLREAYISLAVSGCDLSEITSAWESNSLYQLMVHRGVDVQKLAADGVHFHRPDIDEIGIYRLIAEVRHAVSGRFCACWRQGCPNHSEYETRLSKESEGDYGFHGVNTWERWQLFNFYARIFEHPDFDAQMMHNARRNNDPEALEKYLDSLIPDFGRQIRNNHLTDFMFPKLKARVRFPNGRPPCYCIVHDVIISASTTRGIVADDSNSSGEELGEGEADFT